MSAVYVGKVHNYSILKAENKSISSERIKVEHSIGGMKRYRILSERLRIHDFDLYDNILNVCAELWNFYLAPN